MVKDGHKVYFQPDVQKKNEGRSFHVSPRSGFLISHLPCFNRFITYIYIYHFFFHFVNYDIYIIYIYIKITFLLSIFKVLVVLREDVTLTPILFFQGALCHRAAHFARGDPHR